MVHVHGVGVGGIVKVIRPKAEVLLQRWRAVLGKWQGKARRSWEGKAKKARQGEGTKRTREGKAKKARQGKARERARSGGTVNVETTG